MYVSIPVPLISIDTANVIRSNAAVIVRYGALIKAFFPPLVQPSGISTCPICKDLLKSKAESLSTTANEAVINFEKKFAQAPTKDDDEETSDGEGESSEDEDNENDFAELLTSDERAVGDFLSIIAL